MKKIMAIVGMSFLAACSNEPSESDMKQAVEKSIQESNQQMASLGLGGSFKSEVPEVKKVGCKEDGENAYRCDVEFVGKGGKKLVPARFVKGSDGWVVAN